MVGLILECIVLGGLAGILIVLGITLKVWYDSLQGLRNDMRAMRIEMSDARKHISRLQPPDSKPQAAVYRSDEFVDAETLEIDK